MNEPKITLQSFIIPFVDGSGEESVAYIPQPTEAEMIAMVKPLGFLFSRIKNAAAEGSDFLVIVKDWDILFDEHFAGAEKEKQKKILNAFFDRRIVAANIFNKETGEVTEGAFIEDKSVLHELKGILLFFVSALRYAPQLLKTKELLDFVTSKSALEYQASLKKLHAQREESRKELAKLKRASQKA